MIALTAMLILGYISTDFERKRTISIKYVMERKQSANLVKHGCMHKIWGVFLKTNIVLGFVRISVTKRGNGCASKKVKE